MWSATGTPKRPSKHHSSPSFTLFVINTIRVKFLICLASYPVPGAAFHPDFHTHLISPNICLPILNSQMCMAFCKLETTYAVKFLEKGSASGYSMIIAKVFESVFKSVGVDIKLEVSDDRRN